MQKFQDQAIRILDKINTSQFGALNKAFDRLKGLGWTVREEFNPFGAMYDKVWEHRWAEGINSQHKTDYARDLQHHFFTLYALVDMKENLGVFEPFEITVGRIGNTRTWFLIPPDEYVEDRQDVIDQQLLFKV